MHCQQEIADCLIKERLNIEIGNIAYVFLN